MTNETFEPMGLVDITREITKLNRNRKRLDDMTDRLQSALDAKHDLQGQVSADYANQLDTAVKRNQGHWQNGYDAGYEVGYEVGLDDIDRKGSGILNRVYDEGYKAGRNSEILEQSRISQASEKRDRELLESHGIDVEPLFENVQKIIADHDQDVDEDEPDQYPVNYGGTK